MASTGEGSGANESEGERLDQMPGALLCTIMSKLDVGSICSIASTCTAFRASASHLFGFIPNFHLLEIALSIDLLGPLLPPNPYLRSLKLDCERLDDSAISFVAQPSLQELCVHNCTDFSGKLLSEIGGKCPDLRCLYLGSVAEKRGRAIHISDLEELLSGCRQLEALVLMFDVSLFLRHNFTRVWALASEKLESLEIGYVSSVMVTELLSSNVASQSPNSVQPSILPNIQKLNLSVDYITDTMVGTISSGVNDLGLLLMADNCANMESICLGGFCRVTDTGFKTILHSCSRLCKLKVCHGTHLTDLVFHDISATALSLTHVSLRWCYLLTNHAIANLVSNTQLKVLDLRECKSLGDQALKAIGKLSELKILKLDGSDVSDSGLSFLRPKVIQSLMSLSVRGCKRLTDKCISSLFEGTSNLELQELDLSNIPNLTDEGILSLARSRVPVSELRLRQCPLIGDTSVMALASMQVNEDQRHGNCLRLLDLYNCGGITQLAFRIAGSMNRDIVDALARNRRFLHVALHGEEIGPEQWDNIDGVYMHEYDDMDELEEWLIGGGEFDDIDMVDAENAADLLA
ncbi:F-box/LRR-repeat protein 10 [Linum perenne]